MNRDNEGKELIGKFNLSIYFTKMDKQIRLEFKKKANGKYDAKYEMLTHEIEKDGQYFSYSTVLRTYGASFVSMKDARKKHKLDIHIFFQIHMEDGTLHDVLESMGWMKTKEYKNTDDKHPSFQISEEKNQPIAQFA